MSHRQAFAVWPKYHVCSRLEDMLHLNLVDPTYAMTCSNCALQHEHSTEEFCPEFEQVCQHRISWCLMPTFCLGLQDTATVQIQASSSL